MVTPRRKWQGPGHFGSLPEHVEGTEGRGGRPGSREECARRLSGLMMRAGFHRQAGDCLSHKAQGFWATSRQEPQNRSSGFWGAWASLQQPFLTDRHPPWRNLGASACPTRRGTVTWACSPTESCCALECSARPRPVATHTGPRKGSVSLAEPRLPLACLEGSVSQDATTGSAPGAALSPGGQPSSASRTSEPWPLPAPDSTHCCTVEKFLS